MTAVYIPTSGNTIPKIIEACRARLAIALKIDVNVNTSTTENAIAKSSLHFENKEFGLAINTLCAHLENNSTKWSPVVDVAVLLLVDIAIFTERIAKLQKVFLTYQKISSHEKTPRIEYITNHVVARLDDLMASHDLTTQDASSDALFLASILPEPATAGIKVGSANASPLVAAFVSLYFRKYRFTFSTNNQAAYLSTMSKMLDLLVRHKLGNLLAPLSNSLRDFSKDIFARTEVGSTGSLEAAIKNSSGAVILLRFSVLEAAIKLSQWQVVKSSLEEIGEVYRQIDDAVKRVNRINTASPVQARHVTDLQIANRRFATIADAFLKCQNWPFHADALMSQFVFASEEDRQSIATKATIAALSAPIENDESDSKVSLGFFEDQTPAMRLASTLSLTRIPTRDSVIADLGDSIIETADSNVRALYKIIIERKSVDIATLFKHLEALKNSAALKDTEQADADRYLRSLERSIIEFYMDTHFQTSADLDLKLFESVKLMFPKQNDYVMIAAGLAARVDMKSRVASFNTAELKIRNCISAIGTKTSKMLSLPIVKRKIAIDATALERENTRLNNRVSLSVSCVNKASERAANLSRKELDEAKALREEIEREERERHQKLRAATFEKMKKKVEHAENVERRKKVVDMIAKRSPGIIIPPKVVEDGKNFMDRASAILAQYRRDAEERRTISLREAHYLEKYIRDTEKPKREELEQNMAEQYKKDSEARIENFKQQHRRNFENQRELKARLDKYRARAEEYQKAALASAAAATKVSKRDEQEDMLKAEKERLMREMQ